MSAVRRRVRFAALLAVCVVCPVWFVSSGSPAAAHTDLVSSDPAGGSRLARAPEVVTLVFTDDLHDWGTAVAVTAPGGVDVTDGPPATDGAVVTQAVTADAPAGAWTVAYRVVGEDGHPVEGTVGFDVVTAAGDAAVPVALVGDVEEPPGPSRALLAALTGLALVIGAAMLLRRRP